MKSLSYFSLLLVLALLMSLPGLFSTPFHTRGEPREALVSKQMIDTGNWVLPRRYGEKFATKPPLLHWAIAALYTIAGETTAGLARLPSALFSLFAVLALFSFIKSERSAAESFLVCICLLLCFEWHRAAHSARVDMLLASSLCLAWISYFRWFKNNFKGFPVFFLLFLTLAVLSKGPVALVLPAAVIGSFIFLRKTLDYHAYLKTGMVFILACSCALLWYIMAYAQGGNEFLAVIYDENIARFLGKMSKTSDPHEHSAIYLYVSLIVGLMPWSIIYIEYLIKSWPKLKSFQRGSISYVNVISVLKALPKKFKLWQGKLTDLDLYAFLIVALTLIFFSIPSSKRSVYLLPLYPFICIFIGRSIYLTATLSELITASLQKILYVIGMLLSLSLLTLVFFPISYFFSADSQYSLQIFIAELASKKLLLFGFALLSSYLFFLNLKAKQVRLTIGYLFVLIITLQAYVVPAFARAVSAEPYVQGIQGVLGGKKEIFTYGSEFYEIAFLADLDMKYLDPTEASNILKSGDLIMLHKKKYSEFKNILTDAIEVKLIYQSEGGLRKMSDIVFICEVS